MFERTASLWRRMVGKEAQPAEAVPRKAEERRVGLRYPASGQTTVQPVNGAGPGRLPARLRNISRGGINLLVDRALEPGALLSVDLPGGEGRPTQAVLACVVHVRPHGAGEWAIGCTFSQELADGDLRAFGARREKPPASDDQRDWVRVPCDVRASCRVVPAAAEEPWTACVLNVSPSGIGLLADHAVENGALVNIELQGSAGQAPLSILACVVHIQERDGGSRALGCNFIRELTDAELRALR
jgi:hypothetical protein